MKHFILISSFLWGAFEGFIARAQEIDPFSALHATEKNLCQTISHTHSPALSS